MTSTVDVKRKKAGGREVISLRKEYRGEEHEVMFPLDQDVQVLVNLLAAINEDKETDNEFVLLRRSAVGTLSGGFIDSEELIKESLLESIVTELYDDGTASEVSEVINNE